MSKVTDAAKNLPDDPDLALVTFADRVSQYFYNIAGDLTDNDAIFVLRFVLLFSKKFSVNVTVGDPGTGKLSTRAMSVIEQIIKEKPNLVAKKVDNEIESLLSDYAAVQENSFGLAHLNEDEKKKILHGIERIRETIGKSDLSERKKNALYDRLADLIREVNSHGTRTDRFFAFAGDVAFVMGDMANKAKPLLTEVKEVLRIVSRSRARQEGISLPPGDEVLRLPSPSESSTGSEE